MSMWFTLRAWESNLKSRISEPGLRGCPAPRERPPRRAPVPAARQGQGDGYCLGPGCFRPFFTCLACLSVLNVGLALLHWRRFSRFYAALAARRQEEHPKRQKNA